MKVSPLGPVVGGLIGSPGMTSSATAGHDVGKGGVLPPQGPVGWHHDQLS